MPNTQMPSAANSKHAGRDPARPEVIEQHPDGNLRGREADEVKRR